MICCKCNKDKPEKKCIIKREICIKCDRHERYMKNRDRDLTQQKKLYAEKYKNDPEFIERRKEYHRARKENGLRIEYLKKTLWHTDRYKIESKLRANTRRHLSEDGVFLVFFDKQDEEARMLGLDIDLGPKLNFIEVKEDDFPVFSGSSEDQLLQIAYSEISDFFLPFE